MSGSNAVKVNTAVIVELLQQLKYPAIEGVADSAWFTQLLYEPSEARNQLLCWLINQILPPEDACDATENVHEELLNRLCSLGLCCSSDRAIVEGTAPALQQSVFIKLLAQAVQNYMLLDRVGDETELHDRTEKLLHSLCQNKGMRRLLRSEGSSVLPADLHEKYKMWCKQNSQQQNHASIIHASLENTEKLLINIRAKHNNLIEAGAVDPPSPSKQEHMRSRMKENLGRVDQNGRVFGDLYSTHLRPWVTGQNKVELPNTGQVVKEASDTLNKLNEMLKSAEKLTETSESLAAVNERVLETLERPRDPSLLASLHNIATNVSREL